MKTKNPKRIEAGKKRWKGISKKKRSDEMRERALQMWAKIREGKYSK